MTKAETEDLIRILRNKLLPKYEFPYYSLVRIETRHYGTVHIPAPVFTGSSIRSQWAGSLPIASDIRDWEYFNCPFCGTPSFFSGVCEGCRRDFEVWDYEEEQWVDGDLPLEYRNHEALKDSVKNEILRRIDAGMQDLGILSAEIVLSIDPHETADAAYSPFFKDSSRLALHALEKLEIILQKYEALEKRDDVQKILKTIEDESGVPFGYEEGEEIHVEGSDEIRRQVNGYWQHKHESHDYWHPIDRVHKGSQYYQIEKIRKE